MKRKSISESKLRRIIQEELEAHRARMLIEKKWADFNAPIGKAIPIFPEDFDDEDCVEPPCPEERDLDDEIFDLIQNAYGDVPLGYGKFGNIRIVIENVPDSTNPKTSRLATLSAIELLREICTKEVQIGT